MNPKQQEAEIEMIEELKRLREEVKDLNQECEEIAGGSFATLDAYNKQKQRAEAAEAERDTLRERVKKLLKEKSIVDSLMDQASEKIGENIATIERLRRERDEARQALAEKGAEDDRGKN